MNNNNYAVIMAGGIGSRFWPMSRSTYPKQFLDILDTGETLIQQTFRRLAKSCPAENILVVTNAKYKKLCLEQLGDMLEDNSEISVIKLILKLNLAVVKNSLAERKIKNYLLFNPQ